MKMQCNIFLFLAQCTSISNDIASLPAKGPDDSKENKIENPALTKIQSDEKEIVDFSVVKSQEILESEDL